MDVEETLGQRSPLGRLERQDRSIEAGKGCVSCLPSFPTATPCLRVRLDARTVGNPWKRKSSAVEDRSLPIFTFRYPCNNCGKTYKWRESLNLHKRMECGIEPRFSCKICGRRFKHKHHVTKHHKSIHNYVDQ
ncbi:uncharacterized protein LOC100878650 [Megachile rotundata]|uniref:uncharacterized protein LOC100878650 n=1 Tax=Megachile rotundata TaxID=143995 RepID=UPI003FD0ED5A